MKRLTAVGIMILIITGGTFAGGYLEGNAVLGSAHSFPDQGSFVATNAFPQNSIIDIRDLNTDRTVRAIVVGRSTVSGVFMVLSPNTAGKLKIDGDAIIQVRALPVTMPGMIESSPLVDLPYHPDPDINPAAELYDPNAEYFALNEERVPEPAPEPRPEPAPEPAPEPGRSQRRSPEPSVVMSMPRRHPCADLSIVWTNAA